MSPNGTTPLYDPMAKPVPEAVLERLKSFSSRWAGRTGNEQQLSQHFLVELCRALGTPAPGSADGFSPESYCFEKPVTVAGRSERGRIDLYKARHFILEAKCGRSSKSEPGYAPIRGSRPYVRYIQDAYLEQARVYAALLPEGPPPLLIVVDIGWRFWIWRGFDGRFDDFHSPHVIEIPIDRLADEDNARVLLAAFDAPSDLDPSRYQERITREAAASLAPLAQELEQSLGADPRAGEKVARFIMQCIFCMFAEDVELLPSGHFTKLLDNALRLPEAFPEAITRLFAAMNAGGTFDFERIRHFNGALFREVDALALNEKQLRLLADAAALNWSQVDPAIFGTLLERALDPVERHRLGAHYTPRAHVERLVRATIEEPLREEWALRQAEAERILAEVEGRSDTRAERREAARILETFHRKLTRIRVLDPACGTGNFLYVAYIVLKELEFEVLSALRTTGGGQEGLDLAGHATVPEHFLGLEVKPWAAEIAQLVLWIGHLQWELQHRGPRTIQDPVLPTRRSVECRDALITWERTEERRGPDGTVVTHWDGRTMKLHPATGNEVPDETARLPVDDYIGVEQATWPRADFIIGNPPFIGNKHMREALGDGYVDAVRGAYPAIPNTVDFVMYWWHRAAEAVRAGEVRRFGLITTNSLRQTQNRQVTGAHLTAEPPLRLLMAVPDHPWVDGGADVRIAMTVGAPDEPAVVRMASLVQVVQESRDGDAVEVAARRVARIHNDLSAGADVAGAAPLRANEGISFQGMNLVGKGFRLTRDDVLALGYDPGALPPVIRPYLNARDFMQRRQKRYVIDSFGLTADELRAQHPPLFQWLFDRVKPERDQNKRKSRRERWWLFGEAVGKLRRALIGLDRYIATPETSKHRVFEFFDVETCPDHKLYAIALDDGFSLSVLSSRWHHHWALAAGGTLEDRPTYTNTRTFMPFPFPDPAEPLRATLDDLGERLDTYRKEVRARHPDVTLTAMYNVLAKYRAAEALTPKERALHQKIATVELARLHDEIDAAVLEAYGWPADLDDEELLVRLTALNSERATEEAAGRVRWLRAPAEEAAQVTVDVAAAESDRGAVKKAPWPSDPFDQMAAVLAAAHHLHDGFEVEAVAQRFARAPRQRVQRILDTLGAQRLVLVGDDGRYRVLRAG